MPRVALYTFGILKVPYGADILADFERITPSVYGEVEAADGFIAHAGVERPDLYGKSKLGQDFGRWGIYVAPRFYQDSVKSAAGTMIATLSLWRDVEAARIFVYGGLHRVALKRRRDWFRKPEWPGYVLWWVSDQQVPTWGEGAKKLEGLQDNGPTWSGFDFGNRFDPDCLPRHSGNITGVSTATI
jgi:Domain of unknown function (DUF3291)